MYVRVKSTPKSPRKSVQIVQSVRNGGKVTQKIIKHIGVALDDEELKDLKLLGESIKRKLELENILPLFTPEELQSEIDNAGSHINQDEEDYIVNVKNLVEEDRVITGIHDIYGKLFDDLNLKSIFTNVHKNKTAITHFKNIVLSRIAKPDSKRATVAMLEENFGISLNLDYVYKMMDKLDDHAIDALNTLAYQKTKDLFDQKIDIIFFDATTIYFESFIEDDLKKNGYSKDLKFNQPQVVLALMVTKEGLPIGYEAFSGDTFDGHTLIPSIHTLQKKYNIDKVVFVADSGMLSKKNLQELGDIDYIVGARIKNMSQTLQLQILNKQNYTSLNGDMQVAEFQLANNKRLIVTYSNKRAKKDKADREKGINKLRTKLRHSTSLKSQLKSQGYTKYLHLSGDENQKVSQVQITLNEQKIQEDASWDGLKGIITNTTLTPIEILTQYNNLWQVEESFRITKHDLKIRPVYHWKPSRIKAHLAISFAAYMLTRHLEHRVKLQYKKLSPQVIRDLLVSVQKSIVFDKEKKIKYILPSKIKPEAKKIYTLMDVSHTTTPSILAKL